MPLSVPVIRRRRPSNVERPARLHATKQTNTRSLAAAVVATGLVVGALVTTSTSPATAAPTRFQLQRNSDGVCLRNPGSTAANGVQTNTFQCIRTNSNQQWEKVPVGENLHLLRSLQNGKCLEVLSWSKAIGGRIGMWDCHGGANQIWESKAILFTFLSELKNKHSGLCLDTELNLFIQKDSYKTIQRPCAERANAWAFLPRVTSTS